MVDALSWRRFRVTGAKRDVHISISWLHMLYCHSRVMTWDQYLMIALQLTAVSYYQRPGYIRYLGAADGARLRVTAARPGYQQPRGVMAGVLWSCTRCSLSAYWYTPRWLINVVGACRCNVLEVKRSWLQLTAASLSSNDSAQVINTCVCASVRPRRETITMAGTRRLGRENCYVTWTWRSRRRAKRVNVVFILEIQ